MTKPALDDLEAVRTVVNALGGFESHEQQRIIRWAQEKLGMSSAPIQPSASAPPLGSPAGTPAAGIPAGDRTATDLKSFVDRKNPRAAVHFAATVAHYYKFEAPASERKSEISSDDLQEACRLAKRTRLDDPGRTLRDAHKLGLLDKGAERGTYVVNTVGENLVAMALPAEAGASPRLRRKGASARRKHVVRGAKRVEPRKPAKRRGPVSSRKRT